ncbi:ABC transporter permease [Paenibacillus xerothermodurans]|uniref:ABC transporter permease n=1 Tax=Paenibacillus xerothermodurans TaxID=1977292 RepID=A0A2W1N6L2_PAEXE|nr:ABC transporter permease [Paenibacillus xerothermodurans]PZE20037.1 ABC transporter permease [Paenibacillus xerothermodurans]
MSSFVTVMTFTMRNKLRTKAFLVTILIISIILSVVGNLPYIMGKVQSTEPQKIGFVEAAAPGVTAPLKSYFDQAQQETDVRLIPLKPTGSQSDTEVALKQAIADGSVDAYLTFEASPDAGFPKVTYKSVDVPNRGTLAALTAALRQIKTETVLHDTPLSNEQKKLLFSPVDIDMLQISADTDTGTADDGKTEAERRMALGLVYTLIIALFMGVMITGQLIASEITAEKSSRVMEILITSVSPLTQMFGRIGGMFLVGLLQLGVYVAVLLINLVLPHNREQLAAFNIDAGSIEPMLLLHAVIFYLTGYLLYAVLYAAVGSVVSRTEDLAQALMPLTLLSLAAFYIGIFGMAQPTSAFIQICSFVPFFAPFVMFLRIGLADPAAWEVALSLGILVLSIAVFGWLSARIYRTGVLMYGKRPNLRELRRAMRAFKV